MRSGWFVVGLYERREEVRARTVDAWSTELLPVDRNPRASEERAEGREKEEGEEGNWRVKGQQLDPARLKKGLQFG